MRFSQNSFFLIGVTNNFNNFYPIDFKFQNHLSKSISQRSTYGIFD